MRSSLSPTSPELLIDVTRTLRCGGIFKRVLAWPIYRNIKRELTSFVREYVVTYLYIDYFLKLSSVASSCITFCKCPGNCFLHCRKSFVMGFAIQYHSKYYVCFYSYYISIVITFLICKINAILATFKINSF